MANRRKLLDKDKEYIKQNKDMSVDDICKNLKLIKSAVVQFLITLAPTDKKSKSHVVMTKNMSQEVDKMKVVNGQATFPNHLPPPIDKTRIHVRPS